MVGLRFADTFKLLCMNLALLTRKQLRLRALLAMVLVSVTLTISAKAQIAPGTVLDQIVAVVGSEPVLASEVNAVALSAMQGQPGPISDDHWSRALDELVNQKVLLTRASRDTTIIISEDQVNRQLDQRTASLAERLGGEAQLVAYYGKTIDEIKASFREDVRRQLMAQQFQGRYMRDITITPSEVRTWFAQIPDEDIPDVPELVRVAHIVKQPLPDESARDAARMLTEALRDSILAEQATLEELAARHSQDPGSNENGGEYNDFNVSDLVPEFGLVASTLEQGGLSQVFETQFGYHVMRLNQRQGDIVSFNHILIRVDDSDLDPSSAIADLEMLRDSVLTNRVAFEAIAKRHSSDAFSAPLGGYVSDPRTGERDLRLEALGPLWKIVIDTMDVGEVSEPVEVQLLDGTRAWHVILLQKRTAPHRLNLETDYALLSQYALQDKRQSELEGWIQDLSQSVYIDIMADRYRPLGGEQ